MGTALALQRSIRPRRRMLSCPRCPPHPATTLVALSVLEGDDLALSVQVLQEFYVQATRSGKPERLTHAQASLLIESFLRFPVQEMTVELLQAALASKARFRISYGDAAIIEAARAQGCHAVLSEDLNHGQDYYGVKVVNPFRKRA